MDLQNLREYIDKLNPEQKQAATLKGGSALVLAAAGSGKTSTLICRIAYLIGEKGFQPHQILAVTFTNKASKEMSNRLWRMGVDTHALWIGTFHGICNKILRYHTQEAGLRKGFYIMDSQEQGSFLKRAIRSNGYDPKVVNIDDLQHKINNYKEAGWRSSQLRIGSQERKFYEFYEEACKTDNCVDFGELMLGCYELFQKFPAIADSYSEKFQHILVDEFQDTSELQYKWLKVLGKTHGNVFAVGDDDQCLPEGTIVKTLTGSKNIEDINIGEKVLSKIGNKTVEKTVMDKFIKDYDGELIKLTLDNGITVSSTPEHNWFANFSKQFSPQKFFTYLMYKKEFGFRIGLSRMHSGSTDMLGVHQRGQHEHADKMWILNCSETQEECRYKEIKISLEYGIPTVPFVARINKGKKTKTVTNEQTLLSKLFFELNTHEKGKKLLNDSGLDFMRPHHISRSRDSSKNNITIILCSDSRKDVALHILEYFTNSVENKEKLEGAGFNVEKHKGDSMFRVRISSTNYGLLMDKANEMEPLLDYPNIIQKGKIQNTRMQQVQASDIISGMIMIDDEGKERVVTKVEKVQVKTKIYDLNIENTHNFFANGIVTHNSIYGWRGARPENLNIFLKDFNAQIIKVEKNYRSDANILEAANAVIKNNTNRQGKNLVPTKPATKLINLYSAFNDEQESSFVASEIKKQRRNSIPYKEMAILYRTNGQSRSLEKALNAHSIPYIVYGGFRFFDRQEVKHAMAYLRLAHNPKDNIAFLRVANVPGRAIGETALQKLDALATENKCSMYEMAQKADAKTIKKFAPFIEKIQDVIKFCNNKKLPDMVRNVIVDSGLEFMYENDKKDGEERLDNLYELISAAEVFTMENPEGNIEEFLAFSTLETDVQTKKRDENADVVKLMTVHSSKGLEFDVVFVTGMEENLFPHANSQGEASLIEEERRLMYVALTRARSDLYITCSEERLIHGQWNRYIKSRFLREIPPKLFLKLN